MNEQRDDSPNQNPEPAAESDTTGYFNLNIPGSPSNPFIESAARIANVARDALEPDDSPTFPVSKARNLPPPRLL